MGGGKFTQEEYAKYSTKVTDSWPTTAQLTRGHGLAHLLQSRAEHKLAHHPISTREPYNERLFATVEQRARHCSF